MATVVQQAEVYMYINVCVKLSCIFTHKYTKVLSGKHIFVDDKLMTAADLLTLLVVNFDTFFPESSKVTLTC